MQDLVHFGERSPTFLAISFMEDNFSTDPGQGDGLGIMQLHYIQTYLLLCGPFLTGPDSTGLQLGSWVPLI